MRFTAYFHDGDDNVCEMMNSGMIDIYDILQDDVRMNPDASVRDVVLDFGAEGVILMSFSNADMEGVASRNSVLSRFRLATSPPCACDSH